MPSRVTSSYVESGRVDVERDKIGRKDPATERKREGQGMDNRRWQMRGGGYSCSLEFVLLRVGPWLLKSRVGGSKGQDIGDGKKPRKISNSAFEAGSHHVEEGKIAASIVGRRGKTGEGWRSRVRYGKRRMGMPKN